MISLRPPSEIMCSGFVLPTTDRAEDTLPHEQGEATLAYGLVMADFGLLLPAKIQSRVIRRYDVCELPLSKPYIKGMVHVTGEVVPVFDLLMLLGVSPHSEDASMNQLLIIGEGPEAVGVTITQTPVKVDLALAPIAEKLPPLPARLRGAVSRCFRLDKYWLDWDYKRFFMAVGDAA